MFIDIVYLKRHRKSSSPTRLTPAIVRHTIVFQHKFPHHTLLLVLKAAPVVRHSAAFFPPLPPLLFRREEPCRVCPVAKPPIPKTWKNVLKRLIIRFLKSCQFQGKLLPLQAERCSVHLRQYSEEKKI